MRNIQCLRIPSGNLCGWKLLRAACGVFLALSLAYEVNAAPGVRVSLAVASSSSMPTRPLSNLSDLTSDEARTIQVFERSKGSVAFIQTVRKNHDHWSSQTFGATTGAGSGFFWDDKGHVVTNAHLMDDAMEAIVRMPDRSEYSAKLVGISPTFDIAVIRVDMPSGRPTPLPLFDSENLHVGQKTLAMGNPFGLDLTLTSGVISALNRTLMDDEGNLIQHLIQTDAAINPGNSGGPLLDSSGRLIGMNTAIYSTSGTSSGVGFAIPANTLIRVIPSLIRDGYYLRPSLGIKVDDSINKLAQSEIGFVGVMVISVEKGSPADRAGIQGSRFDRMGNFTAGDIVKAIDDQPVTSVEDLLMHLDEKSLGQMVDIRIIRKGVAFKVRLRLEART